jgi:hypothetical protein
VRGEVVTLAAKVGWFAVIVLAVSFTADAIGRYRLSRETAKAHREVKEAIDWGMRMQDAAERHLAAVNDAYWREEEGESVASPAFAPYDGCETCVIREVLAGAWPVMVEMVDHKRRHGGELHLGIKHE